MRSCCAVYVDVGYLLAAAATRVTGSSLRRGVQTDYASLITWLSEHAEADSGLPLLRVNWYDAGGRPGGMPDASQDEIGQLPRVKLRLGRLSYSGEQKGVDVRIGLDLAIQARQRVADVVYLVSGDDDLTEAVEDAQSHGVQVVLLAVPRHDEKPLAVSKHLLREVDRSMVIDQQAIDAAFRPAAIPEALIPAAAPEEAQPRGTHPTGDVEGAPGPEVPPTGENVGTPTPTDRTTPEARPGVPVPAPPGRPRPPVAATRAPDSATTPARPSQVQDPTPATSAPLQPTPASPPTPAMFAQRKAGAVALPEASSAPAAPDEDGITPGAVDAVARQVVAAWCTSATPEALAALKAAQPIIPSELDRALLVDLSSRGDHADLDDQTRHDVRARFWYHVGRVKPV